MPTYKIKFSSEKKGKITIYSVGMLYYLFIVLSLIIRSKSHIFLVQFSLIFRAEALSWWSVAWILIVNISFVRVVRSDQTICYKNTYHPGISEEPAPHLIIVRLSPTRTRLFNLFYLYLIQFIWNWMHKYILF